MNHSLSRRRLIGGGLAAAAGALPTWMPRLAFRSSAAAPLSLIHISEPTRPY